MVNVYATLIIRKNMFIIFIANLLMGSDTFKGFIFHSEARRIDYKTQTF
jgi:hypothetical protein